jgi:hypothetical protein
MTTIRLHRHPFGGNAPEVIEVDSLGEWLLARYDGKERGGRPQVYAGEPSTETEITEDVSSILSNDAPYYTVLETPGTGAEAVIYAILQAVAVAVVTNVVMSLLFSPNRAKAAAANRTQESPNNQLSNRENQVRMMQRVEDIYGTVRAIPSLMMPTYNKYIQHRKVEYGYYCVGRGYYDIDDVRDGDTLISQITSASAAVYAPFTSPNAGTPQLQIGDAIIDSILTVSRAESVDGLTLRPQNQVDLATPQTFDFIAAGPAGPVVVYQAGDIETNDFFQIIFDRPNTTGDIIRQAGERHPNIAAVAEVGQTLTITMADVIEERRTTSGSAAGQTYIADVERTFRGVVDGGTVTVEGFAEAANNGLKTVVSHTDTTLTVAESLTTETTGNLVIFSGLSVNYSGTRTITDVNQDGYVILGDAQFRLPSQRFASIDVQVNNGLSEWSDWFTLPDTGRTEVWTNVLAPNGLFLDDGAKSTKTVVYEVQYEQLDDDLEPLGVVETATGELTGATSEERAETLEHVTAWTGPTRVRMRRTTAYDYDFAGMVMDEVKWVDLYSITPVDKEHFGNKTTIHTITRSTDRATSLRSRQLNCLASRRLPTYNGTTFSGAFAADGSITSGTISATSKIVDILAAVAADPKIGRRVLADDVDMAQVWATQQALDAWNEECGQFNHTFDTDELSFEETVNAIASAAFCVAYRQNGKIRLALDRPQAASAALFTHRNKKPRSEVITRRFASDSEYDGVELAYMDPDTETQETIRLPLDGSYTKLKKFEIPGIRSFRQAWLRANREYRRLLSQRLSIETETTTDARSLLPNSRIDVVDNTRFKSYDGEVMAQSGLTLTLSRDVEFLPATPHSIVLMKRDGSLQSIACTAGAAANQVILAGAPAEAVVTTPTAEDGIRTIFSFAADSARGAQAWLVQELKPDTEGRYVRITAVNYSDDYYAADSEDIPDRDSVIN